MRWIRYAVVPFAVAVGSPASAQLYGDTSSTYPIDLPTALRLADADNPTANVARARVQQALAQVDRTRVLWLPTLTFGPSFFYHDGLDQGRSGQVVSLSRGNYTLGIGPSLRLGLADALYAPLVARRGLQAESSRSRAVGNNVQLDVALAYFDLLEAHGLLAVNADILNKAEQLFAAAESGARAGLNRIAADVNRAATEMNLRRQERIVLQGRAAALSARLGQLLGLDTDAELVPYELAVVPVVMVPAGTSVPQMIRTGLGARPEVAAAVAEFQASEALVKHAKAAPLLPRVQFDFVGGGFAAGVNSTFTEPRGFFNMQAGLAWELDALGFGNAATIRGRQVGQTAASFRVREVQVQVAAEIKAAAATAGARFASLDSAQAAVREATEMYRRLQEAFFALADPRQQFDALQPLTAIQALSQARVQYLQQVVEFNRAQFRLYAALGQPAGCGVDAATASPLAVPVLPPGKEAAPPKPPVASGPTLAERYLQRAAFVTPRE